MSISNQSDYAMPIGMQIRRRNAKSRLPRETAIPEFGAFTCQCPVTKSAIEVGMEMDQQTFRRIRQLKARVYCPKCRNMHTVMIASGVLAPIVNDQVFRDEI